MEGTLGGIGSRSVTVMSLAPRPHFSKDKCRSVKVSTPNTHTR